jgi:hypothetical protein
MAIMYSEAQSEEEKDKVIQASQNDDDLEEPKEKKPDNQSTMEDKVQPLKIFKSSNTIPFLALDEQSDKSDPEPHDDDQSSSQNYGYRKRQRPPEGTYKAMNKGLAALTTIFQEEDEPTNKPVEEFIEDDNGCSEYPYDLPPDVVLVGQHANDPMTLDKAL